MTSLRPTLFLLVLALGMLAPVPILAQDSTPGTQRLQAQLRQLQQQKMQAEQARDDLSQQLETLRAQLDKLKADAERSQAKAVAAEARARHLTQDNASTTSKLQGTESELQAMTKARDQMSRDLAQAKAAAQDEAQRLQAESSGKTRQLEMCEAKNLKLYGISKELVDRYQSKGVLDALLEAEPFTQLKRVEAENLLEEYRDKMDAQRVRPAGNGETP